jgi:flagellar secretion chaperone FliS
MTPAGYAGYRNVIVNTIENKEEILLMLYEGALIAVKMARRGIEEKNPKLRGEKISKVMAILTELDCALDREKGGELAENLCVLYRYLMERLGIANIRNDLEALKEVERLLGQLYEGFTEAARREAPPVYAKTAESEMTGGLAIAI